METHIFTPIKTYFKELSFNSPYVPIIFINEVSITKIDISLGVATKRLDDLSLYEVELHSEISARTSNGTVFSLKVIYATLLEILKEDMSKEEMDELLCVRIPQNMYNYLRVFVWNLTQSSGFPPIMLKEHEFTIPVAESEEVDNYNIESMPLDDEVLDKPKVDLNVISCPLGYEWMIKSIRLTEDGSAFLDVLATAEKNDLLRYEEFDLYKYYLRFLQPIEYAHPTLNEDECEASFWDILFQLIFAVLDDVQLIDMGSELPELEFTFNGKKRLVSHLTLFELKSLVAELISYAFASIDFEILCRDINREFYKKLIPNQSISKEDFEILYCCDNLNVKDEWVEKMYKRIKECELQTFVYRI